MRRIALVIVGAMIFSGMGCRAHQLRHDQDKMRHALLDLYTNQLMDNLIRAYNGMPIVQLDYTNMTGTITQDANGSFGEMQTLETQRNPALTTLRRFVNVTNFGLGAAEKAQLTVTANPVLNNNEVYNAYLEFLSKPERFMVTCDPPAPCAAHIVRHACAACCEGKRYFWIPCEYRHDFLRLALVTTVQRGQPFSVPEFYDPKVTRVEDVEGAPGFIYIFLSKPIPNDDGKLSVTLAGEPYELAFEVIRRKIDDKDMKYGQKTDRLLLKLPTNKDGFVIRMQKDPDNLVAGKLKADDFKVLLVNQQVRIDLSHYKPTIPTTEDLIGAIRHEVGLIRLEQIGR